MSFENVKIFAGNSHPKLAERVCNQLKVRVGDLDIDYFSNTETRVKLHESVRGMDVYFIQTGSACSERNINDHIMETMLFMDACKRSQANRFTLVVPCFPYARQDKKDSARAAISAACVAKLFDNIQGFPDFRVVMVELHNPSIQGFFSCGADNLYTTDLIVAHLKKNFVNDTNHDDFVVISPDAGGLERARIVSDKLYLPIFQLVKKRDYSQKNKVLRSELLGNEEDIQNKTAIIIDDMFDTGGTVCKTIDVLKGYGVKDVIVAVTHGIFSGPAIERINKTEALKCVVTSDSLPQPNHVRASDKIQVFSIGGLLSEVIRRLVTNKSISAIFE